jgi:SAM-dependent methyltransferase
LKEKEEKKSIKEIVDNYIDNCSVCGESSHFVYHGGSVRESYRCEGCDASLRHRGQCQSILDLYGDGEKSFKELSSNKKFRKLNIFEPGIIGPLRKYFNGFKNYKQSYYWEDIPFGDSKDGVINQDLQNLTLEDNSVDLIITADIFEHIRKPSLAFNEIFRVLKQGGRHIFTIPVQFPLPSKTIFRVDTSTSEDIHILPERYHIAGDGGKSLVYTDFGKDMLDELEEIGLHTEVIFLDETNDHRKKNITFVSTKG